MTANGSDFIEIKEGTLQTSDKNSNPRIKSTSNVANAEYDIVNQPNMEHAIDTHHSASQQSENTHQTMSPASLAIKLSEYDLEKNN